VALRFAKAYPVVVLARNPSSYNAIVSEIQQQGGEAVGVTADTSDAASVKAAMESIKGKMGGRGLAAAVCEFSFFYPLTFFHSFLGWDLRCRGGSCTDGGREKITSAPGSLSPPSWRRP
jgi:NAD(P)-dependent dehydrogenase (short-subunit alcohol dehydrogenase family)